MPQFTPDQVTFGDVPGYGAWDIGHAREHIQFVQVLAAKVPPVLIPDFDLLNLLTAGSSRQAQMQSHQNAHALLAQVTGATAVDFAQFNLDDQGDFYSFAGYHATTHAQIRAALGIAT
jgi:hypothetical protein